MRYRSTINARDAHALIVKSANDVAHAVAEHIAGSEAKFARRMTGKARQLGLYDALHNASGLYHWRQQTTARDMARLAALLLERFPHFETVWRLREFDYDGKTYISHNRLLNRLYGAMGINISYIEPGYLATALQRDGKRVIVVVLGSDSPQSRDRRVAALAERSLPRAQAKAEVTLSAAQRKRAAAWLNRPASTLTAKSGQADSTQSWKIQVGAFAASNHALSQLKRVRRVLGTHLEMAKRAQSRLRKTANGFIVPASWCLNPKHLNYATSCATSRPIACPLVLNWGPLIIGP